MFNDFFVYLLCFDKIILTGSRVCGIILMGVESVGLLLYLNSIVSYLFSYPKLFFFVQGSTNTLDFKAV